MSKKNSTFARLMVKKMYLYRICSWLKHRFTAWNTGGEGVHSPYLFEWVRMVMSDKNAYYRWDEIEACRRQMLASTQELDFVDYGSASRHLKDGKKYVSQKKMVSDIARGSLARAKYAQMLYRLVNWLGHQLRESDRGLTIVELGTSLGITTAYLASADARDRVLTYEGCKDVASLASEVWSSLGINNISCRVGCIDAANLYRDLPCLDLAFVDANHTYEATWLYFDVLAGKVHEKSVIVIDDIYHSTEMEKAWHAICADERVTTTIDLYQMGLVFFDKRYWRRNYRMRL
jgi:predicted O-methyltransferase YrrM